MNLAVAGSSHSAFSPRSRLPYDEPHDRQGILLLHLPQVRLVAKGIWDRVGFAVELDDLVGYGMIGLVNAVDRFDPSRGILLKTYAEHRIRGAILDGLRSMDWLPRSARQRERQQRQEKAEQEAAAVAPGVLRLGYRLASTAADVPPARCQPPCMEAVFSGGNLSDIEKLVESRKHRCAGRNGDSSPESLCARKEGFDRLAAAVAALPRRHRQVVDLYYRRELSMKQVGDVLQVHESRISQLHAAAIQRLRKHLSGGATADIARKVPAAYPVPEPGRAVPSRRASNRESRSRVAA